MCYAVVLPGSHKLNVGVWELPVKGGGLEKKWLQLGKVRGDNKHSCQFLPLACALLGK